MVPLGKSSSLTQRRQGLTHTRLRGNDFREVLADMLSGEYGAINQVWIELYRAADTDFTRDSVMEYTLIDGLWLQTEDSSVGYIQPDRYAKRRYEEKVAPTRWIS